MTDFKKCTKRTDSLRHSVRLETETAEELLRAQPQHLSQHRKKYEAAETYDCASIASHMSHSAGTR